MLSFHPLNFIEDNEGGIVRNMIFPSVGLQTLSAIIHLSGVSILAHLLARRLRWEDISSWRGLTSMTLPRAFVVLALVDSWVFLFTAGVLIQGAGLELSSVVCALGIYNCIGFYASSKIVIYLFLVEKIHVVWSISAKAKRFHSPIYLTCLLAVVLYGGVIILLLIQRIAYFRDDGACVIGLKISASVTLLTYDLFINLLLTSLFLWPLFRSRFRSPRIRSMALKTLWAAAVALSTSCINILVLTLLHGRQLGWVCLGSCGTDVVVNAVVLFWVTSSPSESSRAAHTSETPPPPGIDGAAGAKSWHTTPISLKPLPGGAGHAPVSPTRSQRSFQSSQHDPDAKGAPTLSFAQTDAEDAQCAVVERRRDAAGDYEVALPHGVVAAPARGQSTRGVRPFKALKSVFRRTDDLEERNMQISITTELAIAGDDGVELPERSRSTLNIFRDSKSGMK